MKTKTTDRRALRVLQPSAANQADLVGSANKPEIDMKKVEIQRRRLNFDVENNPPRNANEASATDALKPAPETCDSNPIIDQDCGTRDNVSHSASGRDQELSHDAYDLLVKDNPSSDYWKKLSEERRRALEEVLLENRLLHEENEHLKAENRYLQKLADHCAVLADLLRELTDGDQEECASEESNAEDDVATA